MLEILSQYGDRIAAYRRHRATARALCALDDRMLKDVGLSRFDIDYAAAHTGQRRSHNRGGW